MEQEPHDHISIARTCSNPYSIQGAKLSVQSSGSVAPPGSKGGGGGGEGGPNSDEGTDALVLYVYYNSSTLKSLFRVSFHRQALPDTQRKERKNGRLRKMNSCNIREGGRWELTPIKTTSKKRGPPPLYSIYG